MELTVKPIKFDYPLSEIEYVQEAVGCIMRSGRLIDGPYTEQLEQAVAKYLGRKYAVAVSSDSAAFEIMLRCVGVGFKYVFISGNAYYSMYQAAKNAGGRPRYLDVDWQRHIGPSVGDIEKALDSRVENGSRPVVVLMQTGGLIQLDIEDKVSLVKERGGVIVEDFAHSMGSWLGTAKAGTFGEIAATSLYATKVLQSGNGGIIMTDDEGHARKAKALRAYGRDPRSPTAVDHFGGGDWRLTEVQAAMALARLERLDVEVFARGRVAQQYDEGLKALAEWVVPVPLHPEMRSNYYKYVVMLRPDIPRDEFRLEMKGRGVGIMQGVYDVPVYKHAANQDPVTNAAFPGVEVFCGQHMTLPLYPSMTEGEVGYVLEQMRQAFQDGPKFLNFWREK